MPPLTAEERRALVEAPMVFEVYGGHWAGTGTATDDARHRAYTDHAGTFELEGLEELLQELADAEEN